MCIQETTVGYWQLDSRWSQYLYQNIYDTHVLFYVKYESCPSRPSPASEGRTATGGPKGHPNIQHNFFLFRSHLFTAVFIHRLVSIAPELIMM